MDKILSSPNKIIWEYFKGLRQLVNNTKTHSQKEQKQEIALTIFLSITIIEAFLNIYFRIIIDEPTFIKHKKKILEDLKNRKSLDYKIRNWPKDVLNHIIDFNSGIGKDFMDLKDKRNALMHFKSTHEGCSFDNAIIKGLSDISIYENLSIKDSVFAIETAEGIMEESFKGRGIEEKDLQSMIHEWTGKIQV